MFSSKGKPSEPAPKAPEPAKTGAATKPGVPPVASPSPAASPAPKPKAPASMISSDLRIMGNLHTNGEVAIEGTVEGDIRAHLVTIGEGAKINGEVIADDVVVHGHVQGKVRGLKVRLTSTAQVEGDIIHKTIAIESGAHFEGSVQRAEDPLKSEGGAIAVAKATVSD